MSGINWQQEYSVNIKILDDQHRQLVETVNLLNDIIFADQDAKRLSEVFDRLMDYVTVHYATEERLMAEHKFPGYEEHKADHEQSHRKILEFKKRFESGDTKLSVELIIYLTDWLHHHWLEVDKQYSAFLNERGVY